MCHVPEKLDKNLMIGNRYNYVSFLILKPKVQKEHDSVIIRLEV